MVVGQLDIQLEEKKWILIPYLTHTKKKIQVVCEIKFES